MNKNDLCISLQDIIDARKIIENRIIITPTIASPNLENCTNMNLAFKAEVFQKIGSFKLRGVLNKLYHLSEKEKEQGVITVSSGNHAQSLAYASSQLGIQAVVVMPKYAAENKVITTKKYGAEVVRHKDTKSIMERVYRIKEERNLTLVHPFDDPLIIAGQGTIGLEILEDSPRIPDIVIVPIGGGGLISGIAAAIKLSNPKIKIIGVEPVGADAMNQSLLKGTVVSLNKIDTIADGLAAPFAGMYTLAHVQKFVDDIILVSDEEILDAMRLLIRKVKIVTEPAGAAGFAALLAGKIQVSKEDQIVCVLSGGNVDTSLLKKIL
ncbi:MAG: threonine/serine dehydratase [Candidatus Heimdallarchaeota archaeon]|nr:threonine/serine dehydratase [Candidatus Heimdallarchaeota archaeon]